MTKRQAKITTFFFGLCFCVFIYFCFVLCSQTGNLIQINNEIKNNQKIYTQLKEENSILYDKTDKENFKKNIIQKAHEDGYVFEDEIVYYDIAP